MKQLTNILLFSEKYKHDNALMKFNSKQREWALCSF